MTSVNEEKKNGSKKGTIVKFIIVAFLSMAVGAVGAIFIYREIGKNCKKKTRCREVHRIFGYFRDDLIFVVFLTFILRSQKYNTRNNNKLKSVLFAIKKIFTKRLTNNMETYCPNIVIGKTWTYGVMLLFSSPIFDTLVGNAEHSPQTATPSASGQNEELSGKGKICCKRLQAKKYQ